MEALRNMDPCEMVVLCAVLAVSLSDGLSAADLNVLGNFIVAVGGLILTWAAQKQNLCESADSSDGEKMSLNDLENAVRDLQKRLDKFEK